MSEVKKSEPVLTRPYLGPILLLLLGELIQQIPVLLIYPMLPENLSFIVYYVEAVIGVLLLVFYWVFTKKQFKGPLKMDKLKDMKMWIFVLIFIVIDFGLGIYDIIRVGFNPLNAASLGMSLMAGFAEEAIFRYMIIATQMKTDRNKGTYLPALILSSVLFGLIHLLNIANGAAVGMTLLQVLNTLTVGFLLGAIYLRTGNIAITILWHVIHDIIGMMVNNNTNGVYSGQINAFDIVEVVVVSVIALAIAFFLLKGHKDDILSVWNERWSGFESLPKAEATEPTEAK